jgi:predicted RNA-binding Zn ribbon-like protein
MGGTEEERSMLEDVHPRGRAEIEGRDSLRDEEHSILADLNGIRDHIQTLEEAARAARAVEFDQLRSVVRQLELVAAAAQAVERDLTQELSDTSRVSVATARLVRERLALALRALSDALTVNNEEANHP